MKVAVVALAFTVTDAGTVAAALLLDNVTAVPLFGALLSVTVPVAAVPPITLVGFTETDDSDGDGEGFVPPPPLLLLPPPHAFRSTAESSADARPSVRVRAVGRSVLMAAVLFRYER